MKRSSRGVIVVLLLALTTGGCGAYRAVETKGPADLAWPESNPRIRLQGLIDLGRGPEGASSKVLRWLGDPKSPFLFRRPYGVAWDGPDLLVADPDAGRVARVGTRGRITLSPEGLLELPIGIAACRDGVVVSDSRSGRLALLDRDLRLRRWLAEGLSRPTGLACRDDRIFVAETGVHRLIVIEADGSRRALGKRGGGPGEFNFPTSIAVDGETLLVGDALNFRIQRIDAENGKHLETFGRLGDSAGEMPRTKGVAVDSAGHVWVSDGYLDHVTLYDLDGSFLISIGGTGSRPGEFSFPAGIATHPDGRVVVADSLNRRLHLFRVLGETETPGEGS